MQLLNRLFAGRPVVLASKSPRRRQLLQQVGLQFIVDAHEVEEILEDGRDPAELARELAIHKARAVARNYGEAFIIAADTIVVLRRRILGKPESPEQAAAMLRRLSGCTHRVYTGFAVIQRPENTTIADVDCTRVTFRRLDEEEIAAYIATGSPMDKAGAYGIQDLSALFVEKIDGCFYNVVGFPLAKFYATCKANLGKGM